MRLLGLDPGLRHTGWGVIEAAGNRLSHVADGVVHSDGRQQLAERLVALFRQLNEILDRFEPAEAAVEETFVNKNPASTLKLGVARGVVLLAPAERGIPVAEYSANLVKKSVVGAGHAEKAQVQMMVRRLLPGCTLASPDAADALAVAICHAHHAATAQHWSPRSPLVSPPRKPAEPARPLRQGATDVEKRVWQRLRAGQLEGLKFRRQEPILGFTVDFVCHERQLVIELDGGQHDASDAADDRRAKLLNQAGFRVLRLGSSDIVENIERVLDAIRSATALPTGAHS